MKKGKKRRKIILKKGKRALKMHLFGLKKISRGGSSDHHPQTYLSGEKIESQKRGRGK